MSKQLLFTKRRSIRRIPQFISKYDLRVSYKDKNKTILENSLMMMVVTKRVLCILVYRDDVNFEMEIKKFFYGKNYEQFESAR